MKIKKLPVKVLKILLANLPRKFRDTVYRRMIHVPLVEPSDFTIKFTETNDEFDQAFRLLQQCYAEIGISEKAIELRATKYHALPTSSIVIAKVKGEVVATLTHVLDGPMGLPCENHWPIHSLRKEGALVAEISSLAVQKKWRNDHGLFMFLTKYILDFAINNLAIDYWVMVTHPKAKDFYSSILCFEPISSETMSCDYVKGAKGFAQRLDLNQLKSNFKKIYKNAPANKNIYEFYFKRKFNTIFKTFKKDLILTNLMNRKYFSDIFSNKTSVLNELNLTERKTLAGCYNYPAVKTVEVAGSNRISHRTPVCQSAKLTSTKKMYPVRLLNVSEGGAKVISKVNVSSDEKLSLSLTLAKGKVVKIPVSVAWGRDQKTFGLKLVGEPSEDWISWSKELADKFHQSFYRSAG